MIWFLAAIVCSFVPKPFLHASFNLSSGIIRPGRQSLGALSPEFTVSSILTHFAAAPCHTTQKSAMNADLLFTGTQISLTHQHRVSLSTIRRLTLYSILPAAGHSCICDEPLVCRCASTSASETTAILMTHMTSMNYLLIYCLDAMAHSRISVFHASLRVARHPTGLPIIPLEARSQDGSIYRFLSDRIWAQLAIFCPTGEHPMCWDQLSKEFSRDSSLELIGSERSLENTGVMGDSDGRQNQS
jgi:hypothetical protein